MVTMLLTSSLGNVPPVTHPNPLHSETHGFASVYEYLAHKALFSHTMMMIHQ